LTETVSVAGVTTELVAADSHVPPVTVAPTLNPAGELVTEHVSLAGCAPPTVAKFSWEGVQTIEMGGKMESK
jgi:hypothetical protein